MTKLFSHNAKPVVTFKKIISWGVIMLRQIVSVTLAVTACVTLIPTKVNAASLSFTADGSTVKKPGESITFKVSLHPDSTGSRFEGLDKSGGQRGFVWDGNELSLATESFQYMNEVLTNTTTIAYITFNVLEGVVKDPSTTGDFGSVKALVRDSLGKRGTIESTQDAIDVVPPVPEPLTIFGTAIGLGCGVLFKRKFSNKSAS